MKKISFISCLIALVALTTWGTNAQAYMFYSDATNDQGGCAQCHTGFRDNGSYVSQAEGVAWNDSLHNVHLNNTTIGSPCSNCHDGVGVAGRTVNIGSSGNAADGVNAISCTGCHVAEGLRAHHAINGITLCAECHPDDPAPQPENVPPPWYGSITNTIVGLNLEPCNANGEEQLAGEPIGLDNDGDNDYDGADSDCGDPCDPNPCDDGNDCTDNICTNVGGAAQCTYPPLPSGTACEDGNLCTGPDACDGAGTCDPGSPTVCPDTGNPCTFEVCNPGTGNCDLMNEEDGTPCDDGDVCTANDACMTGVCMGDSLLGNEGPPGDPTCADGCDNDGDGAIDLADPGCQAADPCDPNPCDDGNDCTDNVCANVDGVAECTYPPLPSGTACGDPTVSECDNADTCDGAGVCQSNYVAAGTACGSPGDTQCDNPDTCNGMGMCNMNNEPDGTTCDDGDVCTDPDTCSGGTCSGAPLPTTEGPPGDPTCADGCDNDGDGLTDIDDPDCQVGDPCVPNPCDDGNDCTDNVCTNVDGVAECTYPPLPSGTACGDPTVTECNNADTCDGAGVCQSNYVAAGTACGSPGDTQCDNPDTCNGMGMCNMNNEPDGTTCDDGDVCTDPDTCSGGTCSGAPLPTTEGPPGDPTCADGCDNDGDGMIDGMDPGCQAAEGDVWLDRLRAPKQKKLTEKKQTVMLDIVAKGDGSTQQMAQVCISEVQMPGPGVNVTFPGGNCDMQQVVPGDGGTSFAVAVDIKCNQLDGNSYDVVWTATISAVQNSDPTNDTLQKTTRVTCVSSDGGGGPGPGNPEICDDGMDNDGDGLVDCDDKDCKKACR